MKPLIGTMSGIFFLMSINGFADEICTDLYEKSCDVGVIQDGTGVTIVSDSHNLQSHDHLQVDKTIDEHFKRNKNAFKASAALILQIICPNSESSTCDKKIISKISELISKRLKTGGVAKYSESELIFMEEIEFIALLNEIQFGKTYQYNIEEQEDKVDQLFPQIKQAMIKKIESSSLEVEKKLFIVDQLKAITTWSSNCGTYYKNNDLDIVAKGALDAYDKVFFLCKSYLSQNSSVFALTTIIAHELAHGIGPCLLKSGASNLFGQKESVNFTRIEKSFAYSNLTQCLRSEDSVQAKNKYISEQGLDEKITINYCNHSDQIEEAVADWFASEVIVEVINKNYPDLTQSQWRNGFRNTFRAKCDQKKLDMHKGFDPHPSLIDRYNSILLANFSVRKKMGCENIEYEKKQCSLNDSSSNLNTKQNTSSTNENLANQSPTTETTVTAVSNSQPVQSTDNRNDNETSTNEQTETPSDENE